MKTTKPLFKQLHEANELVKQKQSEIDELVEFINDAHFESFTEQDNANKLIQKHTKK